MAGAGSPDMKSGIMVHYYVANRDMVDKAFYNSDGEMLIGNIFIRVYFFQVLKFFH
jgi:homogentisate 1,2-dioxygenase